MSSARVIAVARSAEGGFSKVPCRAIRLLAGRGVEGDAHCGRCVKHRSRVRANPLSPNLRQVHLLHSELLEDLARSGFSVAPGDLGENITTAGIDLLGCPRGTVLRLGEAKLEITGLRNPCQQIENFQPGLLRAVLRLGRDGVVERLAGVMAVVLTSGWVEAGSEVTVRCPSSPLEPLRVV